MSPLTPLNQLSVAELARLCADETRLFLQRLPSDERYCFELFRRAIIGRDEEAWARIYQQYSPLVLTWVMQHQEAPALVAREGESGSLVNAAFAKFALAMTPAKMENFGSLAPILKYLKLCVRSVIADEVRAAREGLAVDLDEMASGEQESTLFDPTDPIEEMLSRLSGQEVWQAVLETLGSVEERVLLYLTFAEGLKPSEITALHPRLFPTVDDVYRIKRNVLERLRRNWTLMEWLQRRGYYHRGKT